MIPENKKESEMIGQAGELSEGSSAWVSSAPGAPKKSSIGLAAAAAGLKTASAFGFVGGLAASSIGTGSAAFALVNQASLHWLQGAVPSAQNLLIGMGSPLVAGVAAALAGGFVFGAWGMKRLEKIEDLNGEKLGAWLGKRKALRASASETLAEAGSGQTEVADNSKRAPGLGA